MCPKDITWMSTDCSVFSLSLDFHLGCFFVILDQAALVVALLAVDFQASISIMVRLALNSGMTDSFLKVGVTKDPLCERGMLIYLSLQSRMAND